MDSIKRNLLRAILENQDLPLLPMVDGSVVFPEDDRSRGKVGDIYVGEYAEYDNRIFLDRLDFVKTYYKNNLDWLCENFGYDPDINKRSFFAGRYTKEQFEKNEEARKRMNDQLAQAADVFFHKAIILNIDIPDEDD